MVCHENFQQASLPLSYWQTQTDFHNNIQDSDHGEGKTEYENELKSVNSSSTSSEDKAELFYSQIKGLLILALGNRSYGAVSFTICIERNGKKTKETVNF